MEPSKSSDNDSSSENSENEIELIPIIMPGKKTSWEAANIWEKIFIILRTPFRMVLCISNVTIFFLTYFGFIFPLMWARAAWPRLYWFWEGKLYVWLQQFIASWGFTAGYNVYEVGDDITSFCNNDRVLIMCNHQSTADVPMLMAAFQNKGVATRKLLWLMDIMFRWTPFGIIGRNHGDFFIQQGKKTRHLFIGKLKDHLRKTFWNRDRRWVILFPEGGFFYKRIKDSQAYGKKHGFPHTTHVTLPRYGAVKAILEEIGVRKQDNTKDLSDEESNLRKRRSNSQIEHLKEKVRDVRIKKSVTELRPKIEYLIDVTIAYPNRIPLSLFTLLFGSREKCDIAVHYRVFKVNEIPFEDEIKLRDWMYDVYTEKDRLLDNYYHTGQFSDSDVRRPVEFEWKKIITQYIFWFGSFYIQWKAYSWLLYQVWSLCMIPFQ
uniref:PlsC domain-containing protein n=1 Tax=Parastrongyloides trichosuri TaxID=131310 RepID=A0A0N4ZWW2_PARTI